MKKTQLYICLCIIFTLSLLTTGCGTIFSSPESFQSLNRLTIQELAAKSIQAMNKMKGYRYTNNMRNFLSIEKVGPAFRPQKYSYIGKAEMSNTPLAIHIVRSNTWTGEAYQEIYYVGDHIYIKYKDTPWSQIEPSEQEETFMLSPPQFLYRLKNLAAEIPAGDHPKEIQIKRDGANYIVTIDFTSWGEGTAAENSRLANMDGQLELISKDEKLPIDVNQTEIVGFTTTYWINATNFQLVYAQEHVDFQTPFGSDNVLLADKSIDVDVTGEFTGSIQLPSDIKK